MKSDTKILAYVGGTPGGRAPPDLSTVPVSTDSNFTFVFVLAFVRDLNRDGIFTPVWHPSITPQLIQSLQQANQNRRFVASLAGDNWPWQDPSDVNAWVNNAVTSLTNLKNMYHLDGFDLDYENNIIGTSFITVMEQVMQAMNDSQHFPPRFQTAFSVAPFGNTYTPYQQMFIDDTSWIPVFNYQAYADGLTSVQEYIDKYASLASHNPNRNSNGFREISLGICTTPAPHLRGLQPQDIFTVWNNVHAQGAVNVVIWCLEDSALNNFAVETTIQAIS